MGHHSLSIRILRELKFGTVANAILPKDIADVRSDVRNNGGMKLKSKVAVTS
jgi:hypothetical protein